METETVGVVQNHEGDGDRGERPAIITPLQPDPSVPSGPAPAEAIQPEPEAPAEPEPGQPPKGYEGVPPELWPDKNGNPPKLTEALMRKLRGKYFTVRHPRLTNCGHKFDTINEPKTNCENCWFQFFNTHPQLVEVTDQFRRTHGRGPLIGMRGLKYVKLFERYMATVIALMKQERELRKAAHDVDSQERSDGGSEAVTPATDNQVAPTDQSGSGTSDGSGN
jgi:predicted  nucleic acid-binding Zn-ribbon protein